MVAKWMLPGEPYQQEAIRLKDDHVSGVAELSAPSFMIEEVANTVWKATKLDKISVKNGQKALTALNGLNIELHQLDWAEMSEGLSIACDLNLTMYDLSYLLLADKMDVPVVTADQQLCHRARKRFTILPVKDYP